MTERTGIDPPSVFEELDRELAEPARRWQRRELALGLLLLLLVSAWGGWNWWDGQQKLSGYQAAQRAAAAHDWEQAQASFAAAGDYSDARVRAAEAGRNIAERDRQYQVAK